MSQEVGFDVTADVDGALNRLRQFATEAESAFNRITEAAKRMESAALRAEGSLGGGAGGGRGPSPTDRRREREHWDQLYGRGARRDLRETTTVLRRYQEALRATGQEGRRFQDIDWSGPMGAHRAGMQSMEAAWRAHLRDPRNARMRATLETYGAGGLSAPDVLGRLGGIYGSRAGQIGDRTLAALQQRMAGGLPPGGDMGGGGGGGGANPDVMMMSLAKRYVGPAVLAYGAYKAVQNASQWSEQVDPLFRSVRAGRNGDFGTFQSNLAWSRDALPISAPEMTGLASLYAGSTQDRGAMSVLAGTRIGAGLAVGAGFDTATGVSSVATADFWSGGRQGKAELAAMIAEGLEKSRSVQQGGQVLQQFSAWMAQVGAAGGTVDAGAWWDMMARLSATDSPLAQGAAGANLIEQVTAGIRGSRDDEQQLIFTARALKSAGVNASPWELRSIMEQGPFTPVGDTNLISSRFAKFEKDMGADMEANRPAEFYGRMANMLKVDTAAKAEALHKAYKSGELGAPGLIEWQKRFVAGGGDIAPDSYLDLARAKSARDEDLPALFKELSPGMDRKSLARLDQYFPQDGASKYTPEQQREALMAQLAKGRTRTKGGDIAQATADEVTASVAEFGTQLDGATILLKKFKEELFKMGTSKYWLDSGDNRGRSAPEGVFEGASLGIPDVAPLMGARLLKVALGAGGGFGGGGFGGGGGVQPVSWDGSPMGGFGGGGKAGKAGKGAVAPADVYRYLQSKGVSRPHAIGILASIKGESDFRPDAIGDGGASYGLLQFQKERRKALVDKYGSAPNWKQQIDYALSEKEGKDYLRRKFSDSGDAAEWFTRYFEKPKHPDKDSRIRRGYAAGYERLAPDTPPPAETLPRGTRMSSLSGRAEVELDLSFRDPTTGRVLDTKPPRTVVKLRQAGVSPHAVG